MSAPNGGQRLLWYVTSPNERCGIREYSNYLVSRLHLFGPGRGWACHAAWGSPEEVLEQLQEGIVRAYTNAPAGTVPLCAFWLNHHAALHSAWTPAHLARVVELGFGVVVTQHDTFETRKIMDERSLPDFARVSDVVVTHEAVEGYASHVLPQGVLPLPLSAGGPEEMLDARPCVGTVGFDFPWKGFDDLVKAAKEAGWRVLILSNDMTDARVRQLQELYPGGQVNVRVVRGWLSASRVVEQLAACDATAFLYSCGNSGTSGAIRLGIAARRPVLAYRGCRQFRDLTHDPNEQLSINWCDSLRAVEDDLVMLATQRDYREGSIALVRALADRHGLDKQATRYSELLTDAAQRGWIRFAQKLQAATKAGARW